jgi:DNA-binding CsgD family transcriptional regulator
MQRCTAFLGADQGFFAIWTPGTVIGCGYGENTDEAGVSYKAYYWRKDFVITERLKQLALEVYHRDMLYRPGEIERDEVYNDWSAPNKFCDTVGIALHDPQQSLLGGMTFYHDTEGGNFRDVGVDFLRLLLPGFKAGLRAWLSLAHRRKAVHALLEAAGDGVMLTDLSGQVLDCTASLSRTLRDDPQRDRVHRVLNDAAATVGALTGRRRGKTEGDIELSRLTRTISTARASYRVAATLLPEGVAAPNDVVAVILTRLSPSEPSSGDLRARFGLTARECDVARLLAAGKRNKAVAAALGISAHTALRHTERVLRKLGVDSRAAVAAALSRSVV